MLATINFCVAMSAAFFTPSSDIICNRKQSVRVRPVYHVVVGVLVYSPWRS